MPSPVVVVVVVVVVGDAMYWYRAEMSLARNNIVGTTLKSLDRMPEN